MRLPQPPGWPTRHLPRPAPHPAPHRVAVHRAGDALHLGEDAVGGACVVQHPADGAHALGVQAQVLQRGGGGAAGPPRLKTSGGMTRGPSGQGGGLPRMRPSIAGPNTAPSSAKGGQQCRPGLPARLGVALRHSKLDAALGKVARRVGVLLQAAGRKAPADSKHGQARWRTSGSTWGARPG